MNASEASEDDCPTCRERLEIVSVKFKLSGVQLLTACPNCRGAGAKGPARSEPRRLFWIAAYRVPINR
jgi:hypothetical protein